MKILKTYSAWFLPDVHYTRLEIYIISALLTQNTTFSETLFFPSTIIQWNNLDPHLRKSENFSVFKSNILKFIRPSPNSVYNCHNPRATCLIARLRLGLSHLRELKFKHGFPDTLNPLRSCGNDVNSTEHLLLHCPQFVNDRHTLLSTLGNFNHSLLENTNKVWIQICFLEIRHLVQVIIPRFFKLQLILSYQLKDLMDSFLKQWKLYLLITNKKIIWAWLFVSSKQWIYFYILSSLFRPI